MAVTCPTALGDVREPELWWWWGWVMNKAIWIMIFVSVATIPSFGQGLGPCRNGVVGLEPYCFEPGPPVNGMVMPKPTPPAVPTYTPPPAYTPEAVEIPHTVAPQNSPYSNLPEGATLVPQQPEAPTPLASPSATPAYIQQRNEQNYAAGAQVGNAMATGIAAIVSARRCKNNPSACGTPSTESYYGAIAHQACNDDGYTWVSPNICRTKTGDLKWDGGTNWGSVPVAPPDGDVARVPDDYYTPAGLHRRICEAGENTWVSPNICRTKGGDIKWVSATKWEKVPVADPDAAITRRACEDEGDTWVSPDICRTKVGDLRWVSATNSWESVPVAEN